MTTKLDLLNLSIPSRQVELLQGTLLVRIAAFTIGLTLCWLLSFLLARKAQDEPRGLTLAVSGGFVYALSNLWIMPLIVTIGLVFSGTAQIVEAGVFVVSCVVLVATNLVGIRQVQEAYKFAPATKVQPIQQVPTQIIPILIYFVVFQRTASGVALVLIPVGVALIILSGFLLAKRTAGLDAH